ncbi:MAG: nitroreductase family protein [Candidatus Hydrogenedentes bacterium]|mgnify:FL=1|nr:nitroreductase family protein [Candidatus Hydrogenedentota bacterium]
MNTFDAIEARRAVKHFDPEHRLTPEEEKRLFEAVLLSPTSFNIQNWRFVVVRDSALREQVRAAAWNQAQVTDAALLVVLCADLKSWEKSPERYWRTAPPEFRDFVVPAIDAYYRGREGVQRDEAMRSCGIAAQTLMLAAKTLGYDSCPMVGFDFDAVGRLVNLPEDHVIGLMVSVGKAVEPARPRGGQLALDEVVVTDRFA